MSRTAQNAQSAQSVTKERTVTSKTAQNAQCGQVATPDGIHLNGTCVGRTRRMVGKDCLKELITYKIRTRDDMLYVKDWDAKGIYFTVGEVVSIPIKVQTYSSNGTTRIEFSCYRPRDEEF